MQFHPMISTPTFFFLLIVTRMVASIPTPHMGMEIDSKPDVMTFPTPLHPLEMGPKEPPMDMPEVMPESQNVAVAVDDVPDCNLPEPTALPACVTPGDVDAGACSPWEYYAIGHCLELECPAGNTSDQCMMAFESSLMKMPATTLASCYESKVHAWCKETNVSPVDVDTQTAVGDMVDESPMRPEAEMGPESLGLGMITGGQGGQGLIPELPAIL